MAMRVSSSSRRQFGLGALAASSTAAALPGKAAVAQPAGSLGARVDELKTLSARVEQSGKMEVPEFWPGRLQGQPPPTPKVMLRGDDVPPFVILPGFGNDQVDYVTPNGLPREVGLAAAIQVRLPQTLDGSFACRRPSLVRENVSAVADGWRKMAVVNAS